MNKNSVVKKFFTTAVIGGREDIKICLYFTREAVSEMGGSIVLSEDSSNGSTFIITFPLKNMVLMVRLGDPNWRLKHT